METQRKGNIAETFARQWLEQQGLIFIEANFHCRYGEIDLIMTDQMSDQTETVFVEVRYRSHTDFGTPAESVDHFKQQKLIRAANAYLQLHQLNDKPARIDIVGITELDGGSVEWIRDAVIAEN